MFNKYGAKIFSEMHESGGFWRFGGQENERE
jgi:hypothetical protein